MPGRDDSTSKARGAGRWLAAQQVVWAVAAVGVLAHTASGQQTSDPAVARVLRELLAWEYEPLTMARAQAQAGDPAAARATLQRTIAHASDAESLLAIEKVQAEMGDRDAALKTLLKARKSDLVGPDLGHPDGVAADPDRDARAAKRKITMTLVEIAVEQFRLGERASAEMTFEQAMKSARTLVSDDRGWAIKAVIVERSNAGDFDGALKDVASIEDRAERFKALAGITLRDRVVDIKVLERILRMIETEANPLDFDRVAAPALKSLTEMKIETLIGMSLAQAAAKDRAEAGRTLRKARKIVEALGNEDTRYHWLEQIVRALLKTGDAAEASRIAGAIGKTERNWKCRIQTVLAEARVGIVDPATRKAWDDALRAAETDTQRLRVLWKLADSQAKTGDREAALRILEQALVVGRGMTLEEVRRSGFLDRDLMEARIAEARAKAGDIAGAIRLANTIEQVQQQGTAYAGIAATQAASGDIKGALETAGMIRPPDPKQGYITHLRGEWEALQQIIIAQARAGDVAGALATSDKLGPSREQRRCGLLFIAEGIHQRTESDKRAQPPLKP